MHRAEICTKHLVLAPLAWPGLVWLLCSQIPVRPVRARARGEGGGGRGEGGVLLPRCQLRESLSCCLLFPGLLFFLAPSPCQLRPLFSVSLSLSLSRSLAPAPALSLVKGGTKPADRLSGPARPCPLRSLRPPCCCHRVSRGAESADRCPVQPSPSPVAALCLLSLPLSILHVAADAGGPPTQCRAVADPNAVGRQQQQQQQQQ